MFYFCTVYFWNNFQSFFVVPQTILISISHGNMNISLLVTIKHYFHVSYELGTESFSQWYHKYSYTGLFVVEYWSSYPIKIKVLQIIYQAPNHHGFTLDKYI